MKWHRRPYGYLSGDGRWFLERGGRMSHGTNAWLIWRKADDSDRIEENSVGSPYDTTTGDYCRTLAEITGDGDDPSLWVDTHTEGGWLSEAKETVEILLAEEAGRAAFLEGRARIVPPHIIVIDNPAVGQGVGVERARGWYRGWDRANMAAPVEP